MTGTEPGAVGARSGPASPHRIALVTSDGVRLEVDAEPGRTVLEAARDADLTLPSLCEKGTCGVCRATLTAGTVDRGEYDEEALPDVLREAGGMLLCCSRPLGDIDIALPYERMRIVDGAPPERTGRIVALEEVALETVRIVLALDEHPELGAGMAFEAGQFASLTIPGEETSRAYSLANTSNWTGEAEFFVKLRPGGRFSGYLRDRAAVGDVLTVQGPAGAFGLRENGFRPRWFVCGGTGLAPLMSMMRRMAEWQDPQPVRLILGVETEPEVFGVEDLAALEFPGGAACEVTLNRPGAGWGGATGTAVDTMVERLREAGEPPDIYLCGSPGFLDAATAAALAAGVPEEQLFAERILSNG